MIEIKQDILNVTHGIIVHQVNCQGVMGSGLAKQIRDKWPRVYDKYKEYKFTLGKIQIVRVTEDSSDLMVCNLAGQEFYGRDKQYTDYIAVEIALTKLAQFAKSIPIYIPYKMGCGLGGGDWKIYSSIIEKCIPNAIICRTE